LNMEEADRLDTTMEEYDPARRRRKWLFDPARKRSKKSHRKGRMPAGLRRYWANKRRGGKSLDPVHRRRRHHRRMKAYDPARRRRRHSLKIPRIFGRRGRRYDIASPSSTMDEFTKTGLVTVGSMGHNYLVHTRGILARTYNLGPVNVTQLGAIAWIAPTILRFLGVRVPSWAREIISGVASESTNIPQVESIARGGSNASAGSGGYNWPNAATAQSPVGVGPAGYIPVWAYT